MGSVIRFLLLAVFACRTVNAADTNLLLWLTFANDGWPSNGYSTNGLISDQSGWENHARLFDDTGWPVHTWPSWTNGPGGRSAIQFVTNLVSDFEMGELYTYGTYAGITNFNGGLDALTTGTWMLWASIQEPGQGYNKFNAWLNCGFTTNTWRFGTFYDDNPSFTRSIGPGETIRQQLAAWPAVTNADWHHYAVSWDGATFTAYMDGVVYNPPPAWGIDNAFAGVLVSTNVPGVSRQNWIGIGVATHSGTPDRTDPDHYPNHGQSYCQLADVRIYKTALSSNQINAIYLNLTGSSISVQALRVANLRGSP